MSRKSNLGWFRNAKQTFCAHFFPQPLSTTNLISSTFHSFVTYCIHQSWPTIHFVATKPLIFTSLNCQCKCYFKSSMINTIPWHFWILAALASDIFRSSSDSLIFPSSSGQLQCWNVNKTNKAKLIHPFLSESTHACAYKHIIMQTNLVVRVCKVSVFILHTNFLSCSGYCWQTCFVNQR